MKRRWYLVYLGATIFGATFDVALIVNQGVNYDTVFLAFGTACYFLNYRLAKSRWQSRHDRALRIATLINEDAPDDVTHGVSFVDGFVFHFERIEDSWFVINDSARRGVRR